MKSPSHTDRLQSLLAATLVVAGVALVFALFAALAALVVSVWLTRNDPSVRVAATVFALACSWLLARVLGVQRSRRQQPAARPVHPERSREQRPGDQALDLAALERAEAAARRADLDGKRQAQV